MTSGRFLGRLAARAAVLVMAVGYVGIAVAADQPVVVAPAAPVVEGCPTCTDGAAGAPCGRAGCRTCGGKFGHRAGCNPPKPIAGQLRPGACFGYFQTQWHRWEDVCPLPYQGVGVNDAPRRLPTVPGVLPAPTLQPKSDAPAQPMNPAKSDAPAQPMNPVPKGAGTPAPTPGTIPQLPAPPMPENKFGK